MRPGFTQLLNNAGDSRMHIDMRTKADTPDVPHNAAVLTALLDEKLHLAACSECQT